MGVWKIRHFPRGGQASDSVSQWCPSSHSECSVIPFARALWVPLVLQRFPCFSTLTFFFSFNASFHCSLNATYCILLQWLLRIYTRSPWLQVSNHFLMILNLTFRFTLLHAFRFLKIGLVGDALPLYRGVLSFIVPIPSFCQVFQGPEMSNSLLLMYLQTSVTSFDNSGQESWAGRSSAPKVTQMGSQQSWMKPCAPLFGRMYAVLHGIRCHTGFVGSLCLVEVVCMTSLLAPRLRFYACLLNHSDSAFNLFSYARS